MSLSQAFRAAMVSLALGWAGPAQAGGGLFQLNVGYDVLPFGAQKGLDEITDWYNTSRPWLSLPMGTLGQGHGPAFNVQIAPKELVFHHVGFRQRWSTVEARGISGGVDQARQLRLGAGTLSYGVGVAIPLGDFEDLGLLLAPGATVDLTFLRFTTRTGAPLTVAEQDWTELMKKPVFGGQVYLQLTRLAFESGKGNVGLSIRPYYQFWFGKVKGLAPVNEGISPLPAVDDTAATVDASGYGGFGINASLSFFIGG